MSQIRPRNYPSRSATNSAHTTRSSPDSAASRPSTLISNSLTPECRLSWLLGLIDQDRQTRREIRRLERVSDGLLDEHGTTLDDEAGIGSIAAATLLCEVGDPNRFATESKFVRWCGVGAVALSAGEGPEQPNNHHLDFRGNRRINSVLFVASIAQARDHAQPRRYLDRKASEGKTKRSARRAHKRQLANRIILRMWRDEQARTSSPRLWLDKGASDSPGRERPAVHSARALFESMVALPGILADHDQAKDRYSRLGSITLQQLNKMEAGVRYLRRNDRKAERPRVVKSREAPQAPRLASSPDRR